MCDQHSFDEYEVMNLPIMTLAALGGTVSITIDDYVGEDYRAEKEKRKND